MSISVDPYPNYTPLNLLQRKYLIFSEDLGLNSLARISPLHLLLQQNNLLRHIGSFKYIRADVECEVIMVTNRALAGTFMVSTLPYRPLVDPDYIDINQQLQAEPFLLDVSRQESMRVTLPFLSPHRYYDLTQDFRQWNLTIQNLNLTSTTIEAPSTVHFEVWANLTNVRTFGYLEGELQMRSERVRVLDRAMPSIWNSLNLAGGVMVNRASELVSGWTDSPMTHVATATAAATATSVLPTLLTTAKLAKMFQQPTSSPVKPQLCPDLNGGSSGTTISLGDPVRGSFRHIPHIRNDYDLASLASCPAYLGKYELAEPEDSYDFVCDPFQDFSYFQYISRLFKYYHCDFQVMMRMEAAQDVSAKVGVLLFPTGETTNSYGDVPTWEVSVRGTSDFAFRIPYMEIDHWLNTDQILTPMYRLFLMAPIPQVFSVANKVVVHVFVSPVNVQFASQQSPCNGTLQMEFAKTFSEVECYGTTYQSDFMGKCQDVPGVLSRFSSRDPEVNNLFPFPVRHQSGPMFSLDTYDYVSQLYAFYSGSVDVKYLFTSAPPDGLLQLVTGNSHDISTNGETMKAGNSMILSSQSVWPLLEFNFPYERNTEFDSLDDPTPHFIPEFNQETVIDQILLRPGADFRLYTRLPTPQYAGDLAGAFQSNIQRFTGQTVISAISTVAPSTLLSVALPTFPSSGHSFNVELTGTMQRTAGTGNGYVAVTLGTTSNPSSPLNSITGGTNVLGSWVPWSDVTNSGVWISNFRFERALTQYTNPNWYLRLYNNSTTDTFQIAWTLFLVPFSKTVMPISPDSGYSDVTVWASPTECLPVCLYGGTLDSVTNSVDVTLNSSAVTLDVAVTNSPAVTVTNTVQADVTILSQPVQITGEVSLLGELNVAQPLQVEGLLSPDYPIWTSTYKPV